jgi:hypothetical protein
MGLGLLNWRSIVKAHGGRLTSEPNPSEETAFCRGRNDPALTTFSLDAQRQRTNAMSPETVLLSRIQFALTIGYHILWLDA